MIAKRILFKVGWLALALTTLFFFVPTFIVALGKGFHWRNVSTEFSPDGRLQLFISKRIAFPANEWIDPSVIIRAELCDVTNSRVIMSEQVVLVEDSDFSTPLIKWNSNEVRVIEFDRRNHQTVTLRQPSMP